MDTSIFYDPHDMLSRNCLFNFIIGNRGAGKTYGFKKWAIKSFLKSGAQFIYLRRYKTEFDDFGKFFDDIRDDFPGVEFEVKGRTLYINDKIAGHGVALSTALTKKSTSYKKVDKIGYDEFVIDSKVIHYMKDEVTAFLEFYETVNRLRDVNDEVRVLFLSNSVSVVNPYFLYWNLRPNTQRRFNKFGHMLVEFVKNEEFVKAKYNTRFGQIIQGTLYGRYAVENEFLKDNLNLVERKTGAAKHEFTMIYNGKRYGFWTDYDRGLVYCSEDYDPSNKRVFTLTDNDHNVNIMLVKSASKSYHLQGAIRAYELGYMRFDDLRVKNQCVEIFGLLRS